MTAMKHQKKYTELEQVIYNTCFDDELWVVYAWYGAMRSNAQECVRNAQRYEQNQYRIGPVFSAFWNFALSPKYLWPFHSFVVSLKQRVRSRTKSFHPQ